MYQKSLDPSYSNPIRVVYPLREPEALQQYFFNVSLREPEALPQRRRERRGREKEMFTSNLGSL
ncbi:hypothetical protein Cylst_0434 [Cylindrospermum stagnale PCC 7417]|uniref:Uncharacterized protein n=1 Tax=Cylindrospermum stagnale PCC 7417 TaxID=56107 RepID=K9WSM5_9NOST|nr:hypothetical protein Cylst_0434 [Cylindrospermum stagnale PCC 7417]